MITLELNQIALNLILNKYLFWIYSFYKLWTKTVKKYKFQQLITIFLTGLFFQTLFH